MLVNVTDRPDLCDFTVPSMLDRDPVLVAVGTAGASAGLAKQLRLRLEALLPADLGSSPRRSTPRARPCARAGPPPPTAAARSTPRWRRAARSIRWPKAAPGAWRPGWPTPRAAAASGPVELAIASDDPDDLTLRQARLLGTADCILFEPGIAPAILDRARADAVRLPLPHDGAAARGAGRWCCESRGLSIAVLY